MKTILEFNLPEEREEMKLTMQALDMACVIQELDEYLRKRLKYDELDPKVRHSFQIIRDKLHNIIEEHEVKI